MYYPNRLISRLDGSAEPANEILEQTCHERPLVAQTYSTAIAKGTKHFHFCSSLFNPVCVTRTRLCCFFVFHPGYPEDQGAVGGAGVEDDINALHLDEENEQPPLILETD